MSLTKVSPELDCSKDTFHLREMSQYVTLIKTFKGLNIDINACAHGTAKLRFLGQNNYILPLDVLFMKIRFNFCYFVPY